MSAATARAGQDAAAAIDRALRVEDIAKSYGPTVALRRVTFDLHRGEVHALLGENGAGKSTLVKILSGIVRPDTGALRLDGQAYDPHSLLNARARGVSTAFQELSLPGQSHFRPERGFWPGRRR
jgi:ribose transport system ATP-binding protein